MFFFGSVLWTGFLRGQSHNSRRRPLGDFSKGFTYLPQRFSPAALLRKAGRRRGEKKDEHNGPNCRMCRTRFSVLGIANHFEPPASNSTDCEIRNAGTVCAPSLCMYYAPSARITHVF
jgi:hypothetical protein